MTIATVVDLIIFFSIGLWYRQTHVIYVGHIPNTARAGCTVDDGPYRHGIRITGNSQGSCVNIACTVKSVQVTFTLKIFPQERPQLIMNKILSIHVQTKIKYLDIKLDKKLTWGPHLKKKRKISEQ